MLSNVLRKNDPKEVYNWVYLKDENWKKWKKICQLWRLGRLRNSSGEISDTPTEMSVISGECFIICKILFYNNYLILNCFCLL